VIAAGVVAMAAALCESIARNSLDAWPGGRGAAVQAATLRARADEAAAANARAYAAARDALQAPVAPGTTGRDATLRTALLSAADTLLAITAGAGDCAGLAAEIARGCAPGLRADAAGAAELAAAAARAAAALVEINLALLPGDERRARVREIVAAAEADCVRARETA
jgi:formiminotetrahydrofolate cyclodeaminase